MTDFVTILSCAPGKRAAKRYASLDVPPDDYDAGFLFGVHEQEIGSLDALNETLRYLSADPSRMVIRGRAKADVGADLVPRRCRDTADQPAAFEAAEHHWFALDVDSCDVPAPASWDGDAPRAAVEAWRRTLPAGMREAALVWSWSAKAHLSPTVRGRAWLWSATPVSDGRARVLALDLGTDRSLYNPVQPHYTAAPVMPAGVDDPIPERVLWFEGGDAVLPARQNVGTRATSADITSPVRPLPDVSAIVAAVGPESAYAGERWYTLGAVAGIMRRAGLSARHGEAFVRAWLAGAPPSDRDRSKGRATPDLKVALERMLGAWQREADEVSGSHAWDDDAHAQRIWAACTPRAPWRPAEPEAIEGDPDDVDIAGEDEPLDYIIKGLALAPNDQKISLLGGEAGAGKGPLAAYLAVCVALGVPAFGKLDVRQCNVGILDFEGARLTKRRIRTHVAGLKRNPEELRGRLYLNRCEPGVSVEWIKEWVEERGIGFLIIDSYTSALMGQGVDEKSPEFAAFAKELAAVPACVLAVAHARKPISTAKHERPALGDIAGSYALGAMAATGISVWRPKPDDDALVRVGCMRAPEEPFASFGVRWTHSSDGAAWVPVTEDLPGGKGKAASDGPSRVDTLATRIDEYLGRHHPRTFSASALREALGASHKDVCAALEECRVRRVAADIGAPRRKGDANTWEWIPPEHRSAPAAGTGPRAFVRGGR